MRKTIGIALGLALGALGGCSMSTAGAASGSGFDGLSWVCTTLDASQQYFQGYGTTREQAFQSSMQKCKMEAPDSMTCMGDPNKCMPPKGGG